MKRAVRESPATTGPEAYISMLLPSPEDLVDCGHVEQQNKYGCLQDDPEDDVLVEGGIDKGELYHPKSTFLDLQANMFSHCTSTTAAKYPDCAYISDSVVKATLELVTGLIVSRVLVGQ